MAGRKAKAGKARCGGECACGTRSFPIAISDITPDGCCAIAEDDWGEDADFLRLTIAGSVQINGRVLQHRGHEARIAFFGQIHPAVIAQWGTQRAA